MKHTLIALASALALGSTAYAGSSDYVAPSSSSQMASSPLYKWFAGASVGYFTQADEAYYTLHFGMKFAETGPVSHSVLIEGLYTQVDETFSTTDVVPVTLNYKFDYQITPALSAYAGVGAGVAFLDIDGAFGSDNKTALAAQAFIGLGYDITPAFQVYGGGRYLWVDRTRAGFTKVDMDDYGVELGAKFRF
jgi:opacity protein-like surface antigen